MKRISSCLRLLLLIISGIVILAASGCSSETEYGIDNHTLETNGAESVQADIEMRSGDLTISSGAEGSLLAAELSYNADNEPPMVEYSVNNDLGSLSIAGTAPTFAFSLGGQDNKWDLAFNEQVPLALDVSISDADVEMDLSALSLTQLAVGGNGAGIEADVTGDQPLLTAVAIDSNSGRINLDLTGHYDSLSTIDSETNGANITLDLTGNWEQDLAATFQGGTGNDLTLILPQDTGVSVTADATNKVTADGFQLSGDTCTNDAYGQSAVSININIDFQRGDVELKQ